MCEFLDLVNNCGDPNTPGIKTRVYVVAESDIDTFPTLKPFNPASPGDAATLNGDIVLKALKKFLVFDIVVKTGELKDTLVGELGSKSWETTLEAVIPTTLATVLEQMCAQTNGCPILLVEEKSSPNQVRAMGSPGNPAFLDTAELATGKASGDVRGATVTFKSEQEGPAPVYEGVIDLDPLT